MLETSIETTTMLLWSAKEAVHIQQDYDSAVHSTADQNQMRLLLGAGWRQQSNSFPPYAFFIRLWVGCIWRDATTTMLQHSIVTSISFTFFKSMEFWLIKISLTTEMGGGCLMKRGPIVLKIPWFPIPLVWWVWIEPIGRYFYQRNVMVIFCDSFLLIEMSFANGVTLCRPTPKLYIENLPSSLSFSRLFDGQEIQNV